jgi:hypothetical protein
MDHRVFGELISKCRKNGGVHISEYRRMVRERASISKVRERGDQKLGVGNMLSSPMRTVSRAAE